MKDLELLAPARNADIGIAAIDCGADAVYIAGPAFGARQAAGNPMEDIARLCAYAHRFGARIFLTLNTILYDSELSDAEALLREAADAGVDAVIVQDLALAGTGILPLHASTQCAIRTVEDARFLESLGFSRLVLERQLSLRDIRRIREAVGCELEGFAHGALCVSYSGQCYLSEQIAGRSANRGACIQACRSLYDLEDASGKVLVRNKALLSLKDLNLIGRLEDLARAGLSSFKIEGRLKNISYVRNTVRAYSNALDKLVGLHPDEFRRASFGKVEGGFTPRLDKTFNRGYTELFLDGERGRWAAMDAPKSMGEEVGTVTGARTDGNRMEILLRKASAGIILRNGDGFSYARPGGGVAGFRGDVCEGNLIRGQGSEVPPAGTRLFRNFSGAFEKELEGNLPVRRIPAEVDLKTRRTPDGILLEAEARSQDGRTVRAVTEVPAPEAQNTDRMRGLITAQISKASGIHSFSLNTLDSAPTDGALPHLPAAALNALRRELAERLDDLPCGRIPLPGGTTGTAVPSARDISYKANVANARARNLYETRGASSVEDAFEQTHGETAELMRMKYCIRYELGRCPVHQGAKDTGPLFLVNNGRRYALHFNCAECEMSLSAADPTGPQRQR